MAKKTKKNIAKGKNKKKREARKARQAQDQLVADQEQSLTPEQEAKVKEKQDKEKAKAIAEAKKKKQRKENPNLWDKSVNFIKSTISELKKTQWLDAAQLNKATGSVFGIVTIFTAVTWVVDSGLGALTALILGI